MKPSGYSVTALWKASLRDLPNRRPSFFIAGMVVLALVGLLVGWAAGIGRDETWRLALPVVFLLPVAVTSAVLLRPGDGRRRREASLSRTTILAHTAFSAMSLVTLSAYFMRFALETLQHSARLPAVLPAGLLGVYAGSFLSSVLWAPRSLPRSPQDDALAARREVRWLPLALGCQGFLIALGVFLGAWFLHDDLAWEDLFVAGVTALGSTLLLFFGIQIVYRFAVLALHSIPPDLLHKANNQVE